MLNIKKDIQLAAYPLYKQSVVCKRKLKHLSVYTDMEDVYGIIHIANKYIS